MRKGINGVKLQVWYVGAKPYTTAEAVQQFLDAVTERRLAGTRGDEPQLMMATDAELAAAGLLQ